MRNAQIRRFLWIAALFFSFCNNCQVANAPFEAWTWLHRRVFDAQELENNKQKNELKSAKYDVDPFGQLIFSWNALRPETGYFSFYVQVRDAKTKKWGKWHQMAQWGAGIQRSYASARDSLTHYVHVRLEMRNNNLADAFAIKIESHEGADLSLMHSFVVSLTDFSRFRSELDDRRLYKLPSVRVRGVPKLSQFELDHPRNDGLCSPTSCTMLTSFLLNRPIDPLEFAHKSFDDGLDKYGSWPFNIAHAYECANGEAHFCVARLNSFASLHNHLKKGIPVVVSVRGSIKGAPKVYHNGHLLIVVGYDTRKKEVICHDPAAPTAHKTLARYALKHFLAAWERSHRLAYMADIKMM